MKVVQTMLRHSRMATTADIYAHVLETSNARAQIAWTACCANSAAGDIRDPTSDVSTSTDRGASLHLVTKATGVTTALTAEERQLLRESLRGPRGHYSAQRAGQLSGVPERTVYYWATERVLVPDYDGRPKSWSYRDLVYLRLTAWLRTHRVPLDQTVSLVQGWRRDFEGDDDIDVTTISTDGVGIGIGVGFDVDALTGQRVLATMVDVVETFDVLAPLDVPELGRSQLWGPNLIRPSAQTSISPWVMRGEPVVRGSRVSTSALYAMNVRRRLSARDITELYPGLTVGAVTDAIGLETQLRRAA